MLAGLAHAVDAAAVVTKFYCHCLMKDDSEVYLVARALDEATASKMVHKGYDIAFVLDILTPLQWNTGHDTYGLAL